MQPTNRIRIFTACLLSLGLLCGGLCAPATAFAREPLDVVTTIFPPYDFVRHIAGDVPVKLTMLLAPGAESHSFEPSPQDIITIQNSDLFIYAGGEGDAWVDRILESMSTDGMVILSMVDMVDALAEEIVEGMEHEHDEDEFDPDSVYDRALGDWTGAWKSLAPYLADGSLDAYVQTRADEDGVSLDERLQKQQSSWRTDDFDTFMVVGDTLYIDTGEGTHSGTYAYAGYSILQGEAGASVWYQYTLAQSAEGMPQHIVFNDHQYGGPAPDEAGGHDHSHGVAHTHLRYGNESLDALVNAEGWSPFFVDAAASTDEILGTLTGHGGHSHDHAHDMDEHVWTSPVNAIRIAQHIAAEMARLDSANTQTYTANLATLTDGLQALDAAFRDTVKGAARRTVLFGDRFPFRYFADAYDLTYYAAFAGCSTSTDASAGTIAFLIDKAQEERLPVVFKIELSNGLIANTIAEGSGAKVLEMHSGHNLTRSDFDKGVTYLDVMWRNVAQLEEALQ